MKQNHCLLRATSAALLSLLILAPALRADDAAKPVTVSQLLSAIDTHVGKEVTVEGMAVWVCPHMGCKAQLTDADGASKQKLLVSQGAKMDKFTTELQGDTLRVTGIFRERRVTAADLDAQEAAIKNPPPAAHDHAHGGADCANCPDKKAAAADPEKAAKARENQLAQIAKQREMLAKSSKGYLSFVSIEGEKWARAE
ncbi:hypothetical protein OH491_02955 [Termitidicoccus mucosus]|uniref:HMA domain-containing protein n=1 Tax=Termitidicoccus mucosus TaxID=1184151 RepID=A0A178IND7_9BACT|nr:hypothetical protein AW736_06600 [Opitutaceae bacterium TSB47]